MKRVKLLGLVLISMVTLFGCGAEKVRTDAGYEVCKMGDFIEVDRIPYTEDKGGADEEFIVYDKNTKVMYYMILSNTGNRLALSPYYITEDGKAEIGVYGENYYVIKIIAIYA